MVQPLRVRWKSGRGVPPVEEQGQDDPARMGKMPMPRYTDFSRTHAGGFVAW